MKKIKNIKNIKEIFIIILLIFIFLIILFTINNKIIKNENLLQELKKNNLNEELKIINLKNEIIKKENEILIIEEKLQKTEKLQEKNKIEKNKKIVVIKNEENVEKINENKKVKINYSSELNNKKIKNRVINNEKSSRSTNSNIEKFKKLDLSKIKSYYLTWPTNSKEIINKFGTIINYNINNEKINEGVDIKTEYGSEVISGVNGIILEIVEGGEKEKMIKIEREDGLIVKYSNMEKIYVKKGEIVKEGEVIGKMFENENFNKENFNLMNKPYLHYEIIIENIPVDPMKFRYN